MSENRILKRLGGKLREQSSDIVDTRLPERMRALLDRLTCVDEERELGNGHAAR